jgi:glycosyltransferase involved in cell wall biosynthesis
VVVTVHDLYPFDDPGSFAPFPGYWKRRFFARCMAACDAAACVSQSTRDRLAACFPSLVSRVPVQVVYNYADFMPQADAPAPADDARPFLLAVAQHQPNKRLDLLLEAFALLRRQGRIGDEFNLLVVGSPGSQTERVTRRAKALQLSSSVRWMPAVSDRRLEWLYQNCSAFVASSSMEGFCLPMLEALSFNCRVVASDIPVFHEIAGDVPVYFDLSGNAAEHLADAVAVALSAPPRRAPVNVMRFSRALTAADCMALYSLLLPCKATEASARTQKDQPVAGSQ